MTFNGERIVVSEASPIPSNVTVLCRANRFGRTFNREKAPIGALMDDQSGAAMQVNQICRLWKQDGLISEWDEPGNIASPDFELVVDGDFNESGSMFASILTGATLFLIPSTSSMELDVRGTLTRRETGAKFTAHSVNSWTMWMHLLFLPAFPFSGLGTLHSQRDIAHDLYLQFQAAGAFAPPESTRND
jgi:hypothetical protein